MQYERSPKDSHVETIWYEIDMLRYVYKTLSSSTEPGFVAAKNLLIEGALLHYRNLIRFFSGQNARPNDLSTARPEVWSDDNLTKHDLNEMCKIGIILDKKYFKDISKYLQHVTVERYSDPKGWDLPEMYARLEPALVAFERTFPHT